MTIQQPETVRNLIDICSAAKRDGWYPEVLKGMEAVSSLQAKQMQQTPLYERYAEVAPHPEQFPQLLDRIKVARSERLRLRAIICNSGSVLSLNLLQRVLVNPRLGKVL